MRPTRTLLFSTYFLVAAALPAQQSDAETTASRTAATVDGASMAERLGAWLSRDDLHLDGRVSKLQPEPDFGGGMLIMAGAGQDTPPFAGRIEIARRDAGFAVVSHERLPGVELYLHGATRLVRVTSGSDAVDASTLADDLGSLLRGDALVRAVAQAQWRQTDERGAVRAHAELPARLIHTREVGGFAQFGALGKKVERVEVTATLGDDGALQELALAVVRFDGTAAMSRRMRADGTGVGGGTLTPDQLEIPEDEREDTDYLRDVYTLRLHDGKVGARLEKALSELSVLADEDGF